MSTALPSPLLDALQRGWIVVTSTERGARWLRRSFELSQAQRGTRFWEPPAILAWDTWLRSLWRRMVVDGTADRILLNSTQEDAVWREVIEADLRTSQGPGHGIAVGRADSLAGMAAAAWDLVHCYRCRRELAGRADTGDARAFVRWASGLERICAREGYTTAAELPGILADSMRAGSVGSVGRGVLLVGFDAMTPAMREWVEALAAGGVPIEELSEADGADSATPVVVKAADPEEEWETCARWLRSYLTEHEGARLGVIVPALVAQRSAIERTFRHVLAPELEDITAECRALPFEFSAGVPLSSVPLVGTALEVLAWAAEPLPMERITALVLSPYFSAGPRELLARAEFDAFGLRRETLLDAKLGVAETSRVLRNWRRNGSTPELVHGLGALSSAADDLRGFGTQRFATWAHQFVGLLDAAGWTKGAALDSVEFQAQRRWETALDELSGLDFSGRRASFGEALASLRRIAERTTFAPESQDAPIQILGPLEAAGLEFDAVWFVGAGDLGWPVRTRVNPLLAWGLQRECGMPGSGERDLELAGAVTRRIAMSAPAVVFSYAAESAGEQQRVSPLLNGMETTHQSATEIPGPRGMELPVPVLRVADESVVAAPPEHGLRGGADLLKAQAACGFRAFAEKRLFSAEVGRRELGLNAMERGSVIHDAMHRFWAEIETQAALRELTSEERRKGLEAAVEGALERHMAGAGEGWARAYLETERMRLVSVLGRWVEFEVTRAPFAVKGMEESLRDVRIGPLRLTVRVDRVDIQIVDGRPAGEILLDYKTGGVRPADWLGERPDEPQLPLYAVVRDTDANGDGLPLSGVAFVSLRAGDAMKMAGFAGLDGVLPKPSKMEAASLETQVARWREVLEELARQFHEGVAPVAPKKYPTTCRYCEQRLLCRLDPARLEPETLEDLGDEQLGSEWEVQGA